MTDYQNGWSDGYAHPKHRGYPKPPSYVPRDCGMTLTEAQNDYMAGYMDGQQQWKEHHV